MKFGLNFTPEAQEKLAEMKHKPHLEKRYKAVVKALTFLQINPRHPGLQTHEFTSFKGPDGEKVFEAYAEQNTPCTRENRSVQGTPAAYRIFFFYGPGKGEITVFAITPHP